MVQPTHAPFRILTAGASDVGRKRKHNEDVILVRDDLQLYVVADGAGGHNAGEVAAALAARSICNFIGATVRHDWQQPVYDRFGIATGGRRLAAAIRKANRDVLEIAQKQERYQNMVATVVAAQLSTRSGLLHVAHVGDSRCYRLRNTVLEQLTQDHSLLVEILEREPDLDDEIIAKMPQHMVTRALGKEEHVRVTFRSYAVLPGDRYMLCSDGLSGMVSHASIEDILGQPVSPQETVDMLIAGANEGGGRDNVSVIVVDIESEDELLEWEAPSPEHEVDDDRNSQTQPEIQVMAYEELEAVGRRLKKLDSKSPDLGDAIKKLMQKK